LGRHGDTPARAALLRLAASASAIPAAAMASRKSDVGTQTSSVPWTAESSYRNLEAALPREVSTAWKALGHKLPACISALSLCEERESAGALHCLRHLELRLAPCWQDLGALTLRSESSDQGSLQISHLTQSPASDADQALDCGKGRCSIGTNPRTGHTSLSSVPSPLDSNSPDHVLNATQDVALPQSEGPAALAMQELLVKLQRRAEELNEKLQCSQQECNMLRSALETSKISGNSGSDCADSIAMPCTVQEGTAKLHFENRQPLTSCENVV